MTTLEARVARLEGGQKLLMLSMRAVLSIVVSLTADEFERRTIRDARDAIKQWEYDKP
jgi:hypothetical protein